MEKERFYGTGMWAWLLQRITGFLLVFYLFMHIGWVHGISTPFDFMFRQTRTALLILLLLAVPHALNGFRVFVLDFGIGEKAQKILFWVLMISGIILIIFVYYDRFY
jgi:succinate dehydrogenase / fumarate reductase cytochrome b subunit